MEASNIMNGCYSTRFTRSGTTSPPFLFMGCLLWEGPHSSAPLEELIPCLLALSTSHPLVTTVIIFVELIIVEASTEKPVNFL